MAKIVNISSKSTSALQQLAIAHSMLDRGEAQNCLIYLNDNGCYGVDSEMLRAKAFAELRNAAMSNLSYFKAIRAYLSKGGKIRDPYLKPALAEVVSNCYDLKKFEAAGYYMSLTRRKRESIRPDFTSFDSIIADISLSEKAAMASDDDVGDAILPDNAFLDDLGMVRKLIAKKKYGKAFAMLDKMLERCPSEFRETLMLMAAKCRLESGDHEGCKEKCLEVLKILPGHTRARCMICQCARADGDDETALTYARALAEDGGIEDNDDVYDIAELLIDFKFFDLLLVYAERLRELDDEDYLFVKIYALALHLNGERDRARKLIARQAAMFGKADDARFILHYMRFFPDCDICPELESFYPDEMDREMNVGLSACKAAADKFDSDGDVDAFVRVLDDNALELDYVTRYGASSDDGSWEYLSVCESIAANSDKLPPRFVAALEDRLLDEDLSTEMRELTLHALTCDPARGFIYYVNSARIYRMDVFIPDELLDLPEKFEPLVDAFGIIRCKLAIHGRNEPRKLDAAARHIAKAAKKYKLADKVADPIVYVKMFKFFVDNYDFDNGDELAKACCAVDKIDSEVDIDDLYY